MWTLFLLYLIAILILLYLGWFFRTRRGFSKKGYILFISLLFVFLTGYQFRSARYYYIREAAGAYIPFFQLNLENMSNRQAFEALAKYIEEHYPYFEYKRINWKAIKQRAEDELKANKNFYRVIAGMLSCLQDGHVSFVSLPRKKAEVKEAFGARFIKVNGKWIVKEVYPRSSAEKAGLKPGMELLKINDQPIREALARVPDYLISAKKNSIYGQRFGDLQKLSYLLIKPVNTKISLTYIDLNGGEKTIEVKILKIKRESLPNGPLTFRPLPQGYGYIKIKYFPIDLISFVPSFDKALEKLWDTAGLIIDIRGNPGGAILLTDQILGRFTNHKVNYGGMFNPRKGDFAPFYVVPRHPIYKSPVVVLLDERCGSAASYFAYAASYLKSITLVGRPSMGVVSNPSMIIKLPGGAKVQLVSSGLTDPDRNFVVEWTGVQPDVVVPYNLSDLRQGIDRDLLKAIEILEKKVKGTE